MSLNPLSSEHRVSIVSLYFNRFCLLLLCCESKSCSNCVVESVAFVTTFCIEQRLCPRYYRLQYGLFHFVMYHQFTVNCEFLRVTVPPKNRPRKLSAFLSIQIIFVMHFVKSSRNIQFINMHIKSHILSANLHVFVISANYYLSILSIEHPLNP